MKQCCSNSFTRQGNASYTTVGLHCAHLGMTERGPVLVGRGALEPRGVANRGVEPQPASEFTAHGPRDPVIQTKAFTEKNARPPQEPAQSLPASLSRFGHGLWVCLTYPLWAPGSMSAPSEATTVPFRSTFVLLGHVKTPARPPSRLLQGRRR